MKLVQYKFLSVPFLNINGYIINIAGIVIKVKIDSTFDEITVL